METYFYKISKDVFFNNMKFKDKNRLIDAVKLDWNRATIILNGKKYATFHEFLNLVNTRYSEDLEYIMMLSNQCAHFFNYNKIFTIVNEYDFHFSTKLDSEEENSTVCTEFTINPFIKQAVITNIYNIYKIENDAKVYKVVKIITIINLSINEPILVKLEYQD